MPDNHVAVTADALMALRALIVALVQGTPDAAGTLARLAVTPRLQVIFDEREGLIVVGERQDDGAVVWLDSVCCDPRDPATFGRTPAQLAAAAAVVRH